MNERFSRQDGGGDSRVIVRALGEILALWWLLPW